MSRALVAAVALLALPATALAYCPCYTANSAYNTHNCGVDAVAGKNPSLAEWQGIFSLVSQGPKAWGNAGPALGQIGQGCGKPEKSHNVDASFPCELIKAIAMVETGWRQFCNPDTPKDQGPNPERTIISFDCGYGIGQVTSGMHKGENPAFDRARVAGNATYNLAAGMQILAGKWRATNCVGDNQPKIVEHWYTATWAYNGLAYSNNPNNPNLDGNRGVFNPKVGGSYAYQEKVWGYIQYPPTANHWPSVALAYPNRGGLGNSGAPPDLPDPNCASPTDCNNKRALHATMCGAKPPPPDMAMAANDLAAPRDLAGAPRDLAGAPRDLAGPSPVDGAAGRDLALAGDLGRWLAGDGAPGDLATVEEDAPAGPDGVTVQGGCRCAVAGPQRGGAGGWGFGLLILSLLLRRRRRLSAAPRWAGSAAGGEASRAD